MADKDFLMNLCLNFWVPSETAQPPHEVLLAYPRLFPPFLRKTLRLSESGLELSNGSKYAWEEVREVLVGKSTREHRNFRHLSISLPDRALRFTTASELGSLWSGSSAETMLDCLQHYLPAAKLRTFTFHEPPETRDELENYLAYSRLCLEQTRKDLPCLMLFFVWPLIALPIVMLFFRSYSQGSRFPMLTIPIGLAFLVLAWILLFYLVPRQHRRYLARERAKLEQFIIVRDFDRSRKEMSDDPGQS